MSNTTLKLSNASKPAPKWFRKLKRALSLLADTAIVMLLAKGYQDNSVLMLWLRIGLGGVLQALEVMLANGEEYVSVDKTKMGAGVIVFLCLLASCGSPVEKVLTDPDKYQQVRDSVIARGECVNDTVITVKSDTTIVTDTLYGIDYVRDTVRNDSVVYITETKYKTITQKVTIRDTVIKHIEDLERIKLLQKINAQQKHIADSTIKVLRADAKAWKSKARERIWWLYLLITVALVIVFRKRIAQLIGGYLRIG